MQTVVPPDMICLDEVSKVRKFIISASCWCKLFSF